MRLTFENSTALEGFFAIAEDKKLLKRLTKLIRDIKRSPFSGIGKPEALKGRPGHWSRRIDDYHRIVYEIQDNEIKIHECGGHYEG